MIVNPHLPSGLFHPYQLDESISNFRGVRCTFSFLFDFEYIFLLANSEDPNQTLRPDMTEKLLTGKLSLNTTNLIRRCVVRHLIRVCTVCPCPKNGMLGLYGLRFTSMCNIEGYWLDTTGI